ncbi:MAG: cell division protein FtsX [Bdellovibrionales bacterium]
MRLISESIENYKRNSKLQLTTILVMALCFTTVMVLSLVSMNITEGLARWGNKVEMSVYLADDISTKESQRLKKRLAGMSEVSNFKYVDKIEAKAGFFDRFSNILPDEDILKGENPFPSSFEILLDKVTGNNFSVGYLDRIKTQIEEFDGVEQVNYGQFWFESFAGFSRGLQSSVFLIAAVLSLASFLIVGNAIRALIYKRKQEIEILELIGATSSWIRIPFVINGAFSGFLASTMAIGVSYFLFALVTSKFHRAISLIGIRDQIHFFNITEVLFLVIFGTLIGAIGSYICVKSVNSGWAALDQDEA